MKKSSTKPSTKPSKPLKKPSQTAGTFRLGNVMVRVEAVPDMEGGDFNAMPSPCLRIGLKHNSWQDITGILLHEAMEFAHMMRGHKYRSVPVSNYDSADCTFLFDHAQFGRACSDVGGFMADALPELARIYNKGKKI